MEINAYDKNLTVDSVAYELVKFLEQNSIDLGLGTSQVYYDFPILKNLDESIVISKLLLVSQNCGVVIIDTTDVSSRGDINLEIKKIDANIELHPIG